MASSTRNSLPKKSDTFALAHMPWKYRAKRTTPGNTKALKNADTIIKRVEAERSFNAR